MIEATAFTEELSKRMAGPQRHRLLQGYPMLPLMRAAAEALPNGWHSRELDGHLHFMTFVDHHVTTTEPYLTLDAERPIIIGIIPHTQCNPQRRGCGFCTFGQDPYHKPSLVGTVVDVGLEIRDFAKRWPAMTKRRVDAVYFGGGTANLTPPKELRELAMTLAHHFDLSRAEVTLEGVPALFRSLIGGPIEVLLDMPVRHRRVSMGVQTFDATQLERMGRTRFGNRQTVQRVVDKAHKKGLTASGDFLFNLPFQTRAQMLDDVRAAIELGLDQICIYHLVLHPDQGTGWSKDPSLLAAIPPVEEAAENWLALRELLLEKGYVQTTLTNFERADIHRTDRRFIYEECSFTPQKYDALGFGPLSITTVSNLTERRALKFLRSRKGEAPFDRYGPHDYYFPYDEEDLKLLLITRSLPRLRIERAAYRQIFGADLVEQFTGPVTAVVDAKLATLDDQSLALTPRGMFFADAVAGLFASRRAAQVREHAAGVHTMEVLHEAASHSMG